MRAGCGGQESCRQHGKSTRPEARGLGGGRGRGGDGRAEVNMRKTISGFQAFGGYRSANEIPGPFELHPGPMGLGQGKGRGHQGGIGEGMLP